MQSCCPASGCNCVIIITGVRARISRLGRNIGWQEMTKGWICPGKGRGSSVPGGWQPALPPPGPRFGCASREAPLTQAPGGQGRLRGVWSGRVFCFCSVRICGGGSEGSRWATGMCGCWGSEEPGGVPGDLCDEDGIVGGRDLRSVACVPDSGRLCTDGQFHEEQGQFRPEIMEPPHRLKRGVIRKPRDLVPGGQPRSVGAS